MSAQSGPSPIAGDVSAELLALGSATVYEASKLDCLLPNRLHPAWSGAEVAGRAFPVRAARGDNLALHVALELVGVGDVLVVDAGAAEHGYWGEVLTVAAQARGVAGLVIDGGVRDVARLEQLAFPVFSSCIALRGTEKRWPGTQGLPISFGECTVERGDVIVADVDGVIAVPHRELDRVLDEARHRADAEASYLERLGHGELTLDIYGFRPPGDDS